MLLRSFFTAITRLSIRFRWVTILLTVIALILGVVAATQLNQEFLPNIEFPQTFVLTFRPGASSEDLRDLVTIPLEEAISTIPGVIPSGLESTTTSPISFITVRYAYGVNVARVQSQIQSAIDQIVAEGVPLDLKTTADLTPEIMTKVLGKAPSMFKHFESRHLLAMPPEVLNAALEIDPELLNNLDVLAIDQLAAARVSNAVTGKVNAVEPVQLPQAWRITNEGNNPPIPRILNFSLSDLPVITSSVSSDDPTTTAAMLRELVEKELIPALEQTEGVANVSLSGGQQIPADVSEAARRALEERINNRGGGSSSETPPPQTPPSNTQPTAPALPQSWLSMRLLGLLQTPNPVGAALESNFGVKADLRTAADLLTLKDRDGKALSLSQALNLVGQIPNTAYLRDLTPEVLAYWREQAPDYVASLDENALRAIGTSPLYNGAWVQLRQQAGFSTLNTLDDLIALEGSAAESLNQIISSTPAELSTFATRLVDGLVPETIRYLSEIEPDFATKLSPTVLRLMSGAALAALPEDTLAGLSDPTLQEELKAIIADPSKAAGAILSAGNEDTEFVDDPNAPELAAAWQNAPGLNLRQADDLLKKPFGLSAAGFINAAANSPQGGEPLISTLTVDVLEYLQARDPNFYNELAGSTIKLLSTETLASLPPAVQAKAADFTPTTTVTRTNGSESLVVSIRKEDGANTVAVSDRIEETYREARAKNSQIQLNTVFEQASFIRESIEGVVREGGLGAAGAVLMILVFLNFSLRSTAVAAVSIPTSIAIALILMRFVPETVHVWLSSLGEGGVRDFLLKLFPSSITLNIMTLSGLTVAIGRVVDDAIVVLENIYRQLQKGTDPKEAVIKGTRDVSLAIFAATLTTVVVFLPIGLTGGIIGEFFLPFGLSVTYALVASFVVAITIVPVLALMLINAKNMPEEKEGAMVHLYERALKWSLKNRIAVLAIAGVTLVIGVALFGTRPATFLPSLGEPQISISVSMPNGTPLAQTDLLVRDFEAYLETHKEKGITKYQVTIGSGGGFGDIAAALGGSGGVNGAQASITVGVEVTGEELAALTQEIREKAGVIFGVENVTVSRASVSEQGFGGFAVVVSGDEADIRAVDAKVIETLSGIPGLTNISSSLSLVGDAQSYLRIGGRTAVQYSAELEVTDTLGVTRQAVQAVRNIPDLPAALTVGEGFQSQQQTEGFQQTFSAMGIAVVAVYVVMVFTFGSLLYPFAILFSLPLAVVGAALALTLTDRVLGISALVGMLMLIGIVVTNAIVLLDRVQLNRREKGMKAYEALVEAGRTRLRPILMTAIATMVALAPLALGLSKGAIIATELGTVVIGGLFSSTFLTLVVVPVIYSFFAGMERKEA